MATIAMPKAHGDRGIEGAMARYYARNTGEMMHEYAGLARRVAEELAPGSKVLEVAPGPGYFCIELAKLGGFDLTGLDISHTFVKMAARSAADAGVKVDFRQGSASRMPLMSNTYDFLLCRAAFKNFGDPVGALREMYRVLKPRGRGVIIDMKNNARPEALSRYVNGMALSWFNRVTTKLAFKTVLVKSAYTREQFGHMLGQTKFGLVMIDEGEIGLEITMIK